MRLHLLAAAAITALSATGLAQQGNGLDPDVLAKLVRQYDKNADGKVQKSEYPRTAAAFANLDRDGNGVLDEHDTDAQRRHTTRQPRDDAAVKPPKVGDLAPDFELPMLGMKDTTVKLSSFRGVRPVALIFGSYT